MDAIGWDMASWRANMHTHTEVEVMAVQARPGIAAGVPKLREAWIEVNVDFATHSAQEWLPGEMAADVDQHSSRLGQLKELSLVQAIDLLTVLIEQGSRTRESELFDDLPEIGSVCAALK